MIWVWLGVLGIPLLLAALVPFGGSARRMANALAPFAALPAIALALPREPAGPDPAPWLLMGATLGLDQIGQVFMLVTALIWTAAGIYARSYLATDPLRHRFYFFFLLTMTGNLGVVLATDVVTFYTAFALMTFSAYGLIVHRRSRDAIRAGRIYVVMGVVGEALLLSGLILAAHAAGGEIGIEQVRQAIAESEDRNLTILLLLGGFGIKAGVIPLHFTLPLIYPAAPMPGAAVLAGALIKAGILGWLRLLPMGEADLPGWGTGLVILSLIALFFGVLIGLMQERPTALLAYSSISQMGFIGTGVAVGLARPDAWDTAIVGCLIYVLHHGLIKGGLFLGTGVARATAGDGNGRWLVMGGLGIAALALAGAPLTTGALAKSALKEGAYLGPGGWASWLDWLLPLAAVGTTVLMGRYLWLVWRDELGSQAAPNQRTLMLPWAALLVLAFPVVWSAPAYYGLAVGPSVAFEPGNLIDSTWPVVAGGLILMAIWLLAARGMTERLELRIPAGDIVTPLERVMSRTRPETVSQVIPRPHDPVAALGASWYGLFAESVQGTRTSRFGHWMVRWDVAMLFFLVATIVFGAVMMLS